MMPKLLTLWEIMQPFFATNIASIFSEITQRAQLASTDPQTGQVPLIWRQNTANALLPVTLLCKELELAESKKATNRLVKNLLEDNKVSNQELLWKLDNLRELLESEIKKHLYFRVSDALAKYFNRDSPFGGTVYDSFPSARTDLVEAGNCIAYGCNLAAGFHLMRVAEVGLWALGRNLQIPLAKENKIEFAEWGLIIRQLEDAVKAIQLWPNSAVKEDAHKFYNSALVEIRSFNDGWRRHISHVRVDMPLMIEADALALWGHVERFMQALAQRISESEVNAHEENSKS